MVHRIGRTIKLLRESSAAASRRDSADVAHQRPADLGTVGTGVVVEPFWYDANGNLLFDNRNFYVYDAFNRLVSVRERGTVYVDTQADALAGTPGDEIAHYYYDGLNRRVRTVSKPGQADEVQVAHVFGGGAQVLAEYLVSIGGSQPPGGSDVLQRWFVHGQSFPDPLLMVDRTATVGSTGPAVDDYYWYLKDVLGSVGALADETGTGPTAPLASYNLGLGETLCRGWLAQPLREWSPRYSDC